MMRLTFVGDIACDRPLLRATKKQNYDFSNVFCVEDVFEMSDLVIGNLETCFGGGPRYGYKPFHYNVPDSFCTAIRNAGIGIVSTANNHCMDEGISGLKRTLRVLDKENILHTGTFCENSPRYLVTEIKGKKIAFFSITYSVNKVYEASCCEDLSKYINIIGFESRKFSRNSVFRCIQTNIKPELGKIRRKLAGKKIISAYKDKLTEQSINKEWLDNIDKEIIKAKNDADILIILLHIGGQFNEEPGSFSEFMINHFYTIGVDAIIGHHPHTVQKIKKLGNTIIAYSLGGFCLSPSADYIVQDCLPEYSIALHTDIDEETLKLEASTEIVKCIVDDDHMVHVVKAEIDSEESKKIIKRISF